MKLACDCVHWGNCPFNPQPLVIEDLQGAHLFRELSTEEKAALPPDGEVRQDQVKPGDFVGTNRDGKVYLVAKAFDPARVVAYARSKEGTRCKGDSWLWRKRHPATTELA